MQHHANIAFPRVAFFTNMEGKSKMSDWRNFANCRGCDVDIFFPKLGEPTSKAKKICAACMVREQCLSEHLYERYGIWGGLSEKERRRVRKQIKNKNAA
jgi:WhiB family redox-sensing transcriptional regulator